MLLLEMLEKHPKVLNMTTKLESSIENAYVRYVESLNFNAIKIQKRSWPDRLTVLLNGYGFYIEFKRDKDKFGKREGEKYQAYAHNQLRNRGFHVYLVDDLKQAKEIFEYELRMCKVYKSKTFKELEL